MSGLLSQLMRFASGRKAWGATPFSLKIGKATWSVGTDGFVLFAVKMSGAKLSKDYPKNLEDMLTDAPIEPVVIDVATLKEWAGAVPKVLVPAGDVEFDHQGALLGLAIDRRKLAYLMAKVTLPKINAWVAQPGTLLAFEHPDRQWRAFLAGLAQKPDGDEPVFTNQPAAPTPPKSVFDMIDEVGSE